MPTADPNASAELVKSVILPAGGTLLAVLTYAANNVAKKREEASRRETAEAAAKAAALAERNELIVQLKGEIDRLNASKAESEKGEREACKEVERCKHMAHSWESAYDDLSFSLRGLKRYANEAYEAAVVQDPEYPKPPILPPRPDPGSFLPTP